MTFLKKFWLPLVLLLTILYFVNSMFQSNIDSKRREEARAQQQLAIEKSELESIERTNANYSWIKKFQNLSSTRRLFSADLESEWLIGQPIFLPGYIKDISSQDDENYLVKMRYLKITYPLPSIGLELACRKSTVDRFLANNPGSRNPIDDGAGVAVIAKIRSINTDAEGKLIGKGDCVELIKDVGLEEYKIIKIE